MKLKTPDTNKLLKSAIIGMSGILLIIILKAVFTTFDFAQYETAVLTAVLMWIVNTVKESLKK